MANTYGNGSQPATVVVIGCVLSLNVERQIWKELDIMEANSMKIKDEDSEETIEQEICQGCSGNGGYDASRDCEEYDDWQNCEECNGRGEVELGFYETDEFIPKRDAFMPGD